MGRADTAQLMDRPAAPPWPLILCWDAKTARLPTRPIQPVARQRQLGVTAPPWLASGPTDRLFDFCRHMRRLCADIALRSEPLAHVDVTRILFAVTQARSARPHGLQARVTPMRFRGGGLVRRLKGVVYQIQRYFLDGRELLYLVTFCLPRFLELSFDEKLITLFHELYHIGPTFDGDLRRHAGRCAIHSHSQRLYDQHMAGLARDYLAQRPRPALHAFLRLDFSQLHHRHGGVVGTVVPRPKLIPLTPEA